uniref:Uncharacterized protein n=1 Tax=Anguilla anguilla TaxID=7936 RepID=A0A0E9THV2_ANGAN
MHHPLRRSEAATISVNKILWEAICQCQRCFFRSLI